MEERIARYLASMDGTTAASRRGSATTSCNNVNNNCFALLRHRDADSDSDVSEGSSSSGECWQEEGVETHLARLDSFSGNNNRPRTQTLLPTQLCSQSPVQNYNLNSTAVTQHVRQDGNRHRDRSRHGFSNGQRGVNRAEDVNRSHVINRRHSQDPSAEKDLREDRQHLWHNHHHRFRRFSTSCHPQQQKKLHQQPQEQDQRHQHHRHRRHRSGSGSVVRESPGVTTRHQGRPEDPQTAEPGSQREPSEQDQSQGSEVHQHPHCSERRHSVSRHHHSQKKQQQQEDNDHNVVSAPHQQAWRQRRSVSTVYPEVTPEDPSQDPPSRSGEHRHSDSERNLNAVPDQQQNRCPKRFTYPDQPKKQEQGPGQGQGQPQKAQTPGRMKAAVSESPQHQAWLDTYPRTRLHTVSGSGSDLKASFCHAMSRVHVSPRSRGRAMSLRKPRKKLVEVTDPQTFRPRTASLPARNPYCRPSPQHASPPPGQGDFYTLRAFQTTRKGQLVKRGDSLKSRSSTSVRSSGSGSVTELTHPSSPSSLSPGLGERGGPGSPVHATTPSYRVLMVGSEGVGKSSLSRQFSTSEYLGPFDHSAAERSGGEQNVSLLIDGEESTVHILDSTADGMTVGEVAVDGYVVVFGMDSRVTFDRATDVLYELRQVQAMHSAVILVANKCDLVRSQEVTTEEAKSVAATYDCKYIETSVVLNHNVDELLVGIVTQIRLLSEDKKTNRKAKCSDSEHVTCYSKSKLLLNKFFRKYPISKSCENLYVL